MNNYVLTETSFNKSITDETHREVLSSILIEMKDVFYSSKFDFISDFKTRFNQINQSFKDKQEWDKVIWTDYTFSIVKNSSVGTVSANKSLFFWL